VTTVSHKTTVGAVVENPFSSTLRRYSVHNSQLKFYTCICRKGIVVTTTTTSTTTIVSFSDAFIVTLPTLQDRIIGTL
jgi:hypothetical protein